MNTTDLIPDNAPRITFAGRYDDVRQVRLNENFRSSTGIVESARQVVELNPQRLAKHMESTQAQPWSFEQGSVLALDFPDRAAEAQWIAAKINQLHGTEYLVFL